MTYLTPNDPGAFLDMPVLEPRHSYLDESQVVVCPVCKGHGGWHLKLHAYGQDRHFNQGCPQCGGWGHVEKGSKDETCIHDFVEIGYEECEELGIKHYGHCYHVWRCTKCGEAQGHDSSD